MLILVLGKLGSGKTLYLVYLATKLIRPIWSNFKLYLPNTRLIEPSDIPNLEQNINVFFDELPAWLDCRVSMSKKNRYLSTIQLQSRKRFLYIYGTTQMNMLIDIRYQLQADYTVEAEALGKAKYEGMRVPAYFKYTKKDSDGKILNTTVLTFQEALKIINLYDSLEVIEPIDNESMEADFILTSKGSTKDKMKEIINAIQPNLKEITRSSIKVALVLNEYPTVYSEYVYNILTGKVKLKGVKV